MGTTVMAVWSRRSFGLQGFTLIFNNRTKISSLVVALIFSVLLTACGGGSSSPGNNGGNTNIDADGNSTLYISLTDAEGDFLSYTVDVSQITLLRANGTVVDAVPQSTTVDFAQYVEVSELLTTLVVPPGRYDSATLTLDFSHADIIVQGEEGAAIPAVALDEDGDVLTTLSVDIEFADRDGFVISPGRPAQLTLDFDLDASNAIEIEGGTATVTVMPVLLADTVLEEPKPMRVRGLLSAVSPERQLFELELRPFRIRHGNFGDVDVLVSDETAYEIQGENYSGPEGLTALSQLSLPSAVIASGTWNRDDHSFRAEQVYAGTSVPWGDADALRGTVVGRMDNTLSVRGATIERSDGSYTFNDTVSVLLSDTTRVIQARDPQADINDISVGSALFVSGELSGDSIIDASEGIVRIVPGNVSGMVVSASPLAIDVSLINGRRALRYDFSGTGINEDHDADPENYEVNIATLEPADLDIGDPIRIKGLVADFATAPEDFEAFSLRNAANVRAHMVITYDREGSPAALVNVDDSGLQFAIGESSSRHHIMFAGIPVDISDIEAGVPLLVPGGDRGVYSLSVNKRLKVVTHFSRFVELLNEQLEEGRELIRFDAQGYYDSESNTFSSKRLRIRLTENEEDDSGE